MPGFAFEPVHARGRLLRTVALIAVVLGAIRHGTPLEGALAQPVNLYGLEALLDGSGFVQVAPGEFSMGSRIGVETEGPVHRVRITKAFEIGKFEVTQAQWDAVMRSGHGAPDPNAPAVRVPPYSNPSHFKGANLPVERVSWNDVQRFLVLLSVRDPKHSYRLPTEAEWEYASDAGSVDEVTRDVRNLAWFEGNSEAQTQPVGQKQPNAWGLHDMHGNVSEWVQDWYGPNYYANGALTDPSGPESGSYRVFRGCSWLSAAADCRTTIRLFNFPIDGYYNVGFRLVRTAR
jgi:formylglycine-generating enzyme required for sulfatase activity